MFCGQWCQVARISARFSPVGFLGQLACFSPESPKKTIGKFLESSKRIMSVLNQPSYQFGEFTVDSDQRVLFCQNKPLSLTPKLFDTLLILVENSGRIVRKEELISRLWPDTFVEEANLAWNIQQLRKLLGDNARDPHYIETVPKRGYRFIAPTEVSDASFSAATAINSFKFTLSQPETIDSAHPRRRRALVMLAICFVVVAPVSVWLEWSRSHARPLTANSRTILAVLPFKNLTGDATQDYFGDGLTEEMITELGSLNPQRLGVIARTSVMHYKGSEESSERIGRQLGVQYILEGSVRRDSSKVRISVQLIKVADQTQVWAREFDRELTNLLLLQGEIAQEVVDEIQLTLADKTLTEAVAKTASYPNFEAYDLYLKGQYFWNKRTSEGFRQAIDYFEQATNKDPNFAEAYAGIANSYALMGGYSGRPQIEFINKARSAALRALAINERLPEAHTALALIVQNYDWDWETADKEYRRAIGLNPNYATAHQWYAEHLAFLGHFDDALRESESARELDPFSLIIATDNAAILYFSRQYDRAVEKLRAVLEVDPNFLQAHILEHVYVKKGMYAEAKTELGEWRNADEGPWNLAETAYVLGCSGQAKEAGSAMQKLEQLNKKEPLDPQLIVWASVGMGKRHQAFDFLEKAYTQHSNLLVRLKVDPAFDSLRDDPRFKALLQRIHLS